ncbi:hypothetical protein AB0346_06620 [Nocardia beijingensis]|uniref:hypothetical protein n=1 Tax=Nocardia beijingensis TaxID=95162 RepID=UPI00189398CC|nr:hypothetical protein [Nocardia beijingensis]MBF6078997.1 hypothetical protein [Nocardia beijingensis]
MIERRCSTPLYRRGLLSTEFDPADFRCRSIQQFGAVVDLPAVASESSAPARQPFDHHPCAGPPIRSARKNIAAFRAQQ